MRMYFLLFIMAVPAFSQAQCNKPVDPKKVILFVDTNNSEPEILTAQKAACARGEKLVIVPKNYLEYGKYTKAVEDANRAVMRCASNCGPVQRRANEAYQSLEDFKSSQKNTKAATKETLDELKAQNAKLQTFMISGHDGGGSFGGSKGNFSRNDLSEMMKDYSDINEVKSLMLLGCYTGVQKEVIEWKNIFPDARLIAGYDGSAPLSDKPLGHQYISEILTKEPQLLAQADQAKLQAYTRANIQSLFQMNTAMYISCGPGEGQEFYYASGAPTKKFTPFDINECMKKGPQIDALQLEISKYESGELEPPTNTSSGELRAIYNQARALEHCVEVLGRGPNVNNVFNLLFYKGVKESFAKYYESDLAEADAVFKGMTMQDLENGFMAEIAKLEGDVTKQEQLLELLKNNPEAYFAQKQQDIDAMKSDMERFIAANSFLRHANTGNFPPNFEMTPERSTILNQYYQMQYKVDDAEWGLKNAKDNTDYAASNLEYTISSMKHNVQNQHNAFNEVKQNPQRLREVWSPTAANLENKSRRELMENMHKINGLLTIPGFSTEQKKALSWVNTAVSNHLQHFQNPFSWHEIVPGAVEAPDWPVRYRSYSYDQQHSGGMVGGSMSGGFGGGSSQREDAPQE